MTNYSIVSPTNPQIGGLTVTDYGKGRNPRELD